MWATHSAEATVHPIRRNGSDRVPAGRTFGIPEPPGGRGDIGHPWILVSYAAVIVAAFDFYQCGSPLLTREFDVLAFHDRFRPAVR